MHLDWTSSSCHYSSAAEIFHFRLIRIHSNPRNSISLHAKPAKYKLHLSAQSSLTSETRHFDALTYSLYRRLHQSRSTAVIPGWARRKERLSRSEFRRRTSHEFDSAHVKYGGPKANKWWWWWWWWWSSDYFRYEIFVFQATINPILEMAIQKSELWSLKSEFRNQKSQIAIAENLKSTIMPLVIFNSDNQGLSQFAMSLFRLSNG